MIIVVVGGSAASHFISKKLSTEQNVQIVYHAGANRSSEPTDKYCPLFFSNNEEFLKFFQEEKIDLVIPAVLQPILWKKFREILDKRNIPTLAPAPELATLEWSKIYGKKFLMSIGVPTAPAKLISLEDLQNNFLTIPRPFVLKYDRDWRAGLQTIIVTDTNYQKEYDMLLALGSTRMMKSMGSFNNQHFLIENFIEGSREYSYHAISNGKTWKFIGAARDYKKFKDGDTGFNTSGMGCYSPVPDIDSRVHEYCDKIFKSLKERGTPYKGILYLGVYIKKDGDPIILEINTRSGDPEILTVLSVLDDTQNLSDLLFAAATGADLPEIKFNDKSAIAIRLVNKDYEENLEEGVHQTTAEVPPQPVLWPMLPDISAYFNDNRILLSAVVLGKGESINDARDKVYNFLKDKDLYNYTYRTDIGLLL